MSSHERTSWAKAKTDAALENRYEDIQQLLDPAESLASEFVKGELKFHIGDATPIERVFVAPDEGRFIHAQWDFIARTFTITQNTKSKALVDALRRLAPSNNPALVQQVLDLQRQLDDIDKRLIGTETSLNQLTYKAYDLTPDEIALVERG